MTELDQALLSIYTARCRGGHGTDLEQILPPDRTQFYAYGRQAFAEALRRAGLRAGDEVLLPGFLCGEVLGSLAAVGAIPKFYKVDELLHADVASWDQVATEDVRAVVAVNYFGFPQPLDQIRTWCRAHGATLIEDNAHGFLSLDGDVPLGRRGDLGVFSLRKTLFLPNGGALVDNRHEPMGSDGLSYHDVRPCVEWRYRSKAALKWLIELGGLPSARAFISGIRLGRLLVTGSALPVSPPDRETVVPQEAVASLTTELLSRCDFSHERRRRRDLYRFCAGLFDGEPSVRSLFSHLPEGVVTQGFPLIYTGDDPTGFRRTWWRRGVPLLSWPDSLPLAVQRDAPGHYRRVMLVPFLW